MNLFQKLTSLTRRAVIVLALVGMLGISFSAPAYAATPARFAFDVPPYSNQLETPPSSDQFVIELTDESKIQEARNILNGTQKDKTHVVGRIIKRPAPYNPKWSYQLDPASISFFSMAIEVCDANIGYVEDHLDEAGGAFLPGFYWCPWNSRLVKEIQ
ncbi:BP74-related protein [Microcoleus sp. herbarium2]|uniref:BP74-related protein n=1 Tax=Microcoleus sp. herbarium2 TaxID=3055433 RepID=UPI002FD66AAA